jgi:hypothetical protein
LEQHFLIAADGIHRILSHASILAEDRVVELGAGAGTIARRLPPVRSLTLVERDRALAADLIANYPTARVLAMDALRVLEDVRGEVLLVNLPHALVGPVLDRLRPARFRTVLLTIREGQDLSRWRTRFVFIPVASLAPEDFLPVQPFASAVVEVVDRHGRGVDDAPRSC